MCVRLWIYLPGEYNTIKNMEFYFFLDEIKKKYRELWKNKEMRLLNYLYKGSARLISHCCEVTTDN